jgi:hypothetical protein
MRFDVVKTLRVPVSEPAAVRREEGRSAESLERWIARPENVMGVVFDDGGVEEIAPNLWRVLVLRLGFLDWELCPEFDLAILPDARTKHASGVRMRSDALRLASDARVAATANAPRRRAPPGFADMTVWSDIETELYVARGAGGLDGGGAVKGTTAVCADLRITVAADVPWGLRAIPFFQNAGEAAIGSSIDGVGKSARSRVQAAYEAWVAERGGNGDSRGVSRKPPRRRRRRSERALRSLKNQIKTFLRAFRVFARGSSHFSIVLGRQTVRDSCGATLFPELLTVCDP